MIVVIDKSLEKDVSKINDKKIKAKLAIVIEQLQEAEKLSEIVNLKKLQGASNFYRIRIGDYRLGLIYENDELYLVRFLHRKDIYKFFP
ncbi:MAG: type II toxin-antitoxin system RelE family toxin [Flavobacteriales bacterium]